MPSADQASSAWSQTPPGSNRSAASARRVRPNSIILPNMQWARRSFWFSGKNLVLWGLGLPLGVLAWAGFLWAGWRMLTNRVPGEWRRHILLWLWTGLYFLWQSSALNPTMRYELPIYPMLEIFGAWAVIQFWDLGSDRPPRTGVRSAAAFPLAAGGCGRNRRRGRPRQPGLGLWFHPYLYAADHPDRRYSLDISKYPRADQPADRDPGRPV